ncbi:MAG: hypothetical protein FWG98_03585 [Candidatus Cloacimonetes bacterium]|nr:hypothetical protein [Candidatus Cloacimonadota bacterium]
MKKIPIFLTFALMIMVLGCGGKGIESSNEADSYSVMTMTTSVQMIRFELQGSGTVTIDWSDGSESVNWEFIDNNWTMFTHEFTDATPRTITITGDNITGLNCIRSGLTSLDVSRNTALTVLFCSYNLLTALDVSQNVSLTILGCSNNEITALDLSQVAALISLDCGYNQLTELDVSRNIALNDELHFSYNQLTADALNALFSTLHSNDFTKKEIHIGGNPGSADCDPSIAEAKGWTVEGFEGLHLDKVEVDQVISMTTRHDALNLHLQGSGRVTIDWGDESTIITLNDGWTEFNHDFIKSSLRTITITGENITGLECAHNDLISLDLSRSTALTHLGCSENQLTALDISQNTALAHLNCHSNQLTALDLSRNTVLTYISAGFNPLTAVALNGLFNSLHSNDFEKFIYIIDCPGTADSNKS